MSVNKHLPHVFVLPEDDANRQLANGFQLDVDPTRQRRMQVVPVAGGWMAVVDQFTTNHVAGMDSNPNRFMVLLIDFDGKDDRFENVKGKIPQHLQNRVFIVGAWTKPEDLQKPREEVGSALARDCRDGTNAGWDHELLRHNAGELTRLREHVRPILFGD